MLKSALYLGALWSLRSIIHFLHGLTGNRVEIPDSAATVKAGYQPMYRHMFFLATREGAGAGAQLFLNIFIENSFDAKTSILYRTFAAYN